MTVLDQSCVTFFTGCQSKCGLICKIRVLTYKALDGLAPSYLSEMLVPVTDKSILRQDMSADRGDLTVPRTKNIRYGNRSFAIAVTMLWKNFSVELRRVVHL